MPSAAYRRRADRGRSDLPQPEAPDDLVGGDGCREAAAPHLLLQGGEAVGEIAATAQRAEDSLHLRMLVAGNDGVNDRFRESAAGERG